MTTDRRSFTPEFKRDAAKLVLEQGYTIGEACKAMGVGETAMRRWVEQLKSEHQGIIPFHLIFCSNYTYRIITRLAL